VDSNVDARREFSLYKKDSSIVFKYGLSSAVGFELPRVDAYSPDSSEAQIERIGRFGR
jgi:hypothetical protein